MRFLMVILTLSALGIVSEARAQASFPTPDQSRTGSTMVLVPCGTIVNGEVAACPNGPTTPVYVNCSTCSASAPIGAASNPVSGTITTTGVFQTIIAQNSNRKGCSIQNQGTHNMTMRAVGATVGQILPAFGIAYCSPNSNVVMTDAIEITGTTGDVFAGGWQ